MLIAVQREELSATFSLLVRSVTYLLELEPRLLDRDGDIMNVLDLVVEKFPFWNAGVFLAFVGVCIWLLTKIDDQTRGFVESRRHLWKSTSTYEIEFKRYKSLSRLFLMSCAILNFIWAIVIVGAYVLVR